MQSPDQNVERNRQLLLDRSLVGLKKYGVTTERNDLTTERNDLTLNDWLQHLLEELLDAANYVQAAMNNAAPACPAEHMHKGMLLWILYHHQGGKCPIGQPIRRVLGIEQHAALTTEQVRYAVTVARMAGAPDDLAAVCSAAANQETQVTVSRVALKQVLNALANGPAHHIREMQATRLPVEMFPDNPINILIAEFNGTAKQSGGDQ
ncbi:hypothetical protein [Pseudomonas abyssi]|uniref:hypothetical protein n=1 Tax=Pseudomonas abyssi TaxID=170540 RepID=UPI0015F33E00|nr:hypothetical protein [Halopseudomonas gallaeciensis]